MVAYFRKKGIDHPDTMSSILIKCLWRDAKTNVTEEMIEEYKKKVEREEKRRTEELCVEAIKKIKHLLADRKEELLACYRKVDESADKLDPPPFRLMDLGGTMAIYRVESFPTMKVMVHDCIVCVIHKILDRRGGYWPRVVIEMSPELEMKCYPYVCIKD